MLSGGGVLMWGAKIHSPCSYSHSSIHMRFPQTSLFPSFQSCSFQTLDQAAKPFAITWKSVYILRQVTSFPHKGHGQLHFKLCPLGGCLSPLFLRALLHGSSPCLAYANTLCGPNHYQAFYFIFLLYQLVVDVG